MLAKDPKQRPQRASVVHELFAQALNCKEQPQTKIRLAEEKPLVGEKLERRLVVVPIGSANQPADSSLQKGQAETGDKNSATLVAAKTPKTYKDRGVAYLDKGDYGRAIADLSKAIELKPDYADAYHDRGVAYRRKGDYDLAIADYSKAIELRPDYAFYYHARGDAYRGRGDYDRANADLSRAIELEPSRRAVVDPNIWTPF